MPNRQPSARKLRICKMKVHKTNVFDYIAIQLRPSLSAAAAGVARLSRRAESAPAPAGYQLTRASSIAGGSRLPRQAGARPSVVLASVYSGHGQIRRDGVAANGDGYFYSAGEQAPV